MSIFDKRVAFKPFEYPELMEYKNAINHSFWLISEWNFLGDTHDFHVRLNDVERSIITNAMLAISQIEISVKRFWTRLGERFPKAEFEQVGVTFGESEVRHADAYSHLLQLLGLNEEYDQLLQNPVIQGRIDYLTKYLKGAADNSNENYTLTLTLFSIFIENVSLFSQFLIIKSFNKYNNVLKDIDNVVQATQKEECHSEDTEILTPSGWKLLSKMSEKDPVCQYNEGRIENTYVLAKTDREYSGKMYEIGHKSSNCLVTPGHDMVYCGKDGKMKKQTAEDISYHSEMRVPCGGILVNDKAVSFTWEERLRVAIQANATTLYWKNTADKKVLQSSSFTHSLSLTELCKKEKLRLILSHLSYKFVEEIDGEETTFKIQYNRDHDYNNFDWFDFAEKDSMWCLYFVYETAQWNECTNKDNVGYHSTNEAAANKVHAAAVFSGLRSNLLSQVDKRGYKISYKVSFSQRSLLPAGHGFKKKIVQYTGRVYCVTVASGIIITRRKGRVCVAGNCIHALLGVYIIQKVREEFPDWFNHEFFAKLYRACKKAYEAECNIIDWIFEKGELTFLSKDVVKEFVKNRFNDSLEMIGGERLFDVDQEKLVQVAWFDEEMHADVNIDFFHKKSVTYSKKVKSIRAEDLF